MHIIRNHALAQAENAQISIHDRGFRYGDGLFETLRVHAGVPYRFEWHMGRLARGLEAVRIEYDTAGLADDCRALIHANRMQNGLLRIQITRGAGGRGYLPEPDTQPNCLIETLPLPDVPAQPVDLWGSSYARMPLSALPVNTKLCQGMNAILARMEAADHECFDALMLGENGDISETSSANIFWVKDGVLYTPPLLTGALDGATRAAVMELSPLPVKEIRAGLVALAEAEAVILTNTVWKALPVGHLKPAGLFWKSTEAARLFRDLLTKDIERYSQTHGSRWQADALSA